MREKSKEAIFTKYNWKRKLTKLINLYKKLDPMKIANIVGARPQFIKLAPINRAIKKYKEDNTISPYSNRPGDKTLEEIIIHTGQHYDDNMSKIFFQELNIPEPDYNLGVGSSSHGKQTGIMLKKIEKTLIKEKPDMILVYGDTNSTLAGAIAASKKIYNKSILKKEPKKHSPFTIQYGRPIIAHIEAGLRSNNEKPEEVNRILTDRISDLLFCPTKKATNNLKREGYKKIFKNSFIAKNKNYNLLNDKKTQIIFNVGDVMLDSIFYNINRAKKISNILNKLHLTTKDKNKSNHTKDYYLSTIHKSKNTDNPERLKKIFQILLNLASKKVPIICPLHPRTRKLLEKLSLFKKIKSPKSNVKIIDPVSYFDMLILEKNAQTILTDSGGIQKEAFFLKVPCITLRDYTEWPETTKTGWNILTDIDEDAIKTAINDFKVSKPKINKKPYGNGFASENIIQIIFDVLMEKNYRRK